MPPSLSSVSSPLPHRRAGQRSQREAGS
jgi:hypothetical protein